MPEKISFNKSIKRGTITVQGELVVFQCARHTLWVVHEWEGYWVVTEYFSGIRWVYASALNKKVAIKDLNRQIMEIGEKRLLNLLKKKFKQRNIPTKQIMKRAYKLGYLEPETRLWSQTLLV